MPTIKDVAREASVSIATVSYVLNGKTDAISAETQLRVWDAAKKIGYRPNVTARNLRSSQSRLIGYAWHDITLEAASTILDRFTYAMARSAETAGYHLLIFTYPPDDPIPAYEALISSGRVDGFVISNPVRDDPRVRFLIEREFPFASFGRASDGWDFLWVDTDGAVGIGAAVDYLVGLGHRKITMAAWNEGSLTGDFRISGYFETLERAGITPKPGDVMRGENDEQAGRNAFAAWWERPTAERPTAIVAISDVVAIGIMDEAARRGLDIGRDLSVIGFDDAPMSPYLRPPLTTLRQPIAEIGAALIAMLEGAIRGEPPAERQRLLPPELIIRESCGSVLTGQAPR